MASSSNNKPKTASIVVLDADDADRRFVELQLGKIGRFQIEAAASVSAAIDLLRQQAIDLVITEMELVDGDAFALMKRLRSRPGWSDIPVIFLVRDRRASLVAAALQSGAIDIVQKPFNLPELVARIDAVLARERARRAQALSRNYSLAGDLGTVAFADLVHLLEIGMRDGWLFFTTAEGVGQIRLQRGRMVDAHFGSLEGNKAVWALMRQEHGRFEFQPGVAAGTEKTITMPNTSLLMEGARLLDNWRKERATTPVSPALAADAAMPTGDPDAIAEHALSRETADDLVRALHDPFALGELHFLSRTQVREATSAERPANHALGFVIAPAFAGVSMLAGAASPLGEEQIVSALDWDQRVLGWTLRGTGGNTLDLLLFDIQFAGVMLDAIRTRPAFVVYAPPQGDHLALSHQALNEIVALLGSLRPPAVLAFGGSTMGASLAQLFATAGISPRSQVLHHPVEDPALDFRAAMTTALELATTPTEVSQ